MATLPTRKKSASTALVAVPNVSAQTTGAASYKAIAQDEERFIAAAFSINPLANTLSKTEIFKSMEKAMTQTKAQYEKLTNEAASAGKENVEAILKSTNIWMKGTEDLFKTYMSLTQDTAAKNSEAFKTLLACKNLNELTEAQNKLAQESFDGFMAGATKISELSVKLATEALEPINDQVSKTIRKATDAVAA